MFLQTLEHFSKDYDHTNPEHVLIIPFGKTHYSAFKVHGLADARARAHTHTHAHTHTDILKAGAGGMGDVEGCA